MLDNNKENVATEVAENIVEQATEELVDSAIDTENSTEKKDKVEGQNEKKYTEEEFNQKIDELLKKKIARKEYKIRKEYETKYGPLTNVLSAGLDTDNVEEMTNKMSKFYKENGVEIPERNKYSESEEKILARAEANSIIEAGFDEVVEETDKLTKKGLANMNAREIELFQTLATYRKEQEDMQELKKIGAEDILKNKDFLDFRKYLDKSVTAQKAYELYEKTKPKKVVTEPLGSMKDNTTKNEIKEFYSYEEACKFTKQDFDKNPALFKAVERSMTLWNKK